MGGSPTQDLVEVLAVRGISREPDLLDRVKEREPDARLLRRPRRPPCPDQRVGTGVNQLERPACVSFRKV